MDERKLLESTGNVRWEQHGDIHTSTGGAWYVNRKETSWGHGEMVVKR